MKTKIKACPCCSGKFYHECCGLLISGTAQANTPEALMRSRYSAYTQADIDYIVRTMQSPASDHFDPIAAKKWAKNAKWLRLDVIASSENHNIGYVEFKAHYKFHGRKEVIHENSEFHHIDGLWYYTNGVN